MNLTTLTLFAAQLSGDENQTRYAGQYTNAANLAQQQFASDTLALFKDQTYSVVSGTAAYTLPTDFTFEKKVTLNGIKLEPISRADIENVKKSSDWTEETGTPKYFIIDPEAGKTQILLYPIPQGDDAGTNNLVLTYYPLPTDLVAGSDTPLNSASYMAQFHIGLAAFMAWFLMASESSKPEIKSKREELWGMYQTKVTEAIDRYGNTKSAPMRLRGGRYW